MSNEISFLMSIGWLNNWACCQATSPFPPVSEAVSLKDLEPVRKEVINGSFPVNKKKIESLQYTFQIKQLEKQAFVLLIAVFCSPRKSLLVTCHTVC